MQQQTSSTFAARLHEALDLRTGKIYWAALALAVLPLWLPRYLPLIDMPQHAAQMTALREIGAGNELFTTAFEVNWFTPYLLGYVLLYVLSAVVPVTVAAKVAMSVIVVSLPLATGVLLKELGADPRLRWCAIPASYSFGFYWGFLSYLVAVPLGLLLLVLTRRFDERPGPASAATIAGFSVLLFFGHVLALGFSSLLALSYLAARHYRDLKTLALRALPYTAPLPLIAYWMTRTVSNETLVRESPIIGGELGKKLFMLLRQFAGLDNYAILFAFWIGLVLMAAPRLLGCRLSRRPERWLPAVVGLGVYLVFPAAAFFTDFLFPRLAVFLVPLWLLVWDPPESETKAPSRIPQLAVLLWVVINLFRFNGFAAESRDFAAVVDQMEPGRRVASLIGFQESHYIDLPVYLHFGSWYQAVRAGTVDFSFATFHPQIVRYRDMEAPRISMPVSERPEIFSWDREGADQYDYFLVYADQDPARAIFKERAASVRLEIHRGSWWVYRNLTGDSLPGRK